MNYEEMMAYRAKLDKLGLNYRISIVVFGKTDAEHIYAFTMIY